MELLVESTEEFWEWRCEPEDLLSTPIVSKAGHQRDSRPSRHTSSARVPEVVGPEAPWSPGWTFPSYSSHLRVVLPHHSRTENQDWSGGWNRSWLRQPFAGVGGLECLLFKVSIML